ncbi:MAG: hypothetical protein JXA82_15100 [Sedimentisphaerales bacterium]|nr:hypothetical protein [Sedimentisphaerales bacterium]
MSKKLDRRTFLHASAVTSAVVLSFQLEEEILLAQTNTSISFHAGMDKRESLLPTGRLGKYTITRLIGGGNLTSGFAHSRDLLYVSSLLQHYFTDEKIFETWQLCEQNGINTMILRVDDQVIRLVNEYRKRYNGQFHWIAQCKASEGNLMGDARRALDNGAIAVYIHGGVAERWIEQGRLDLIEKTLKEMRKTGAVIGIGGHRIDVPISCESEGFDLDFYMKTINSKQYWSAGPMPRNDSVWAETPEVTIDFMKSVNKPWIGYKVLGAGAIQPQEGFQYAFAKGCDFICVGMFDFQVAQDVQLVRALLSKPLKRARPWI